MELKNDRGGLGLQSAGLSHLASPVPTKNTSSSPGGGKNSKQNSNSSRGEHKLNRFSKADQLAITMKRFKEVDEQPPEMELDWIHMPIVRASTTAASFCDSHVIYSFCDRFFITFWYVRLNYLYWRKKPGLLSPIIIIIEIDYIPEMAVSKQKISSGRFYCNSAWR
jgi:hypothetical protein